MVGERDGEKARQGGWGGEGEGKRDGEGVFTEGPQAFWAMVTPGGRTGSTLPITGVPPAPHKLYQGAAGQRRPQPLSVLVFELRAGVEDRAVSPEREILSQDLNSIHGPYFRKANPSGLTSPMTNPGRAEARE